MSGGMELGVAAGRAMRDRRRRWVDLTLALAEALPEADRHLIEQVYGHGHPVRHLALAARTSRQRIRRRLLRVLRRVHAPTYRFAIDHRRDIPPRLRPLARLLYIEGHSLRHAARLTGRSLHQTRADAATLTVLHRLSRTQQPG